MPSFVIFDIRVLWCPARTWASECPPIARLSKITNDGMTWSGTGNSGHQRVKCRSIKSPCVYWYPNSFHVSRTVDTHPDCKSTLVNLGDALSDDVRYMITESRCVGWLDWVVACWTSITRTVKDLQALLVNCNPTLHQHTCLTSTWAQATLIVIQDHSTAVFLNCQLT